MCEKIYVILGGWYFYESAGSFLIIIFLGFDHCPVLMNIDEYWWKELGSRLTRTLKCWTNLPDYKEFMNDQWLSFQVDGWGGFVLKENLKLIKDRLKLWHQNHTQNLDDKIKAVKDHISFLDAKGDEQDLTEEKLREINSLSS